MGSRKWVTHERPRKSRPPPPPPPRLDNLTVAASSCFLLLLLLPPGLLGGSDGASTSNFWRPPAPLEELYSEVASVAAATASGMVRLTPLGPPTAEGRRVMVAMVPAALEEGRPDGGGGGRRNRWD